MGYFRICNAIQTEWFTLSPPTAVKAWRMWAFVFLEASWGGDREAALSDVSEPHLCPQMQPLFSHYPQLCTQCECTLHTGVFNVLLQGPGSCFRVEFNILLLCEPGSSWMLRLFSWCVSCLCIWWVGLVVWQWRLCMGTAWNSGSLGTDV